MAASARCSSGLAESSRGRTRGPSSSIQYVHRGKGPPPQYDEHFGGPASNEPLPERPVDVQAIAVMGPTGSGKSTFISKLAGSAVKVGHSLNSCTQNVLEVRCKIGDKYIMLVDTPGFNDTVRSDTEILGLLVDWMKTAYGERHISGLIYLHDISGARMTGTILTNLRMFRKLCGDNNLHNVILATTKWGITPQNNAIEREEELCSNDGFWGLMIKHGSMVRRFENTQASARSLVEELLRTGSDQFTPKIQREVVEEGKNLSQTDAGASIEEALARQDKKHKEEMASLREEQQRALQKHDFDMQREIEKHFRRLERQLAANEEERHILQLNELDSIKRKIRELQSMRKKDRHSGLMGLPWMPHSP